MTYVESSVDAVKYGVQSLAPKFFGGKPDFVVSGSNIGSKTQTSFPIRPTLTDVTRQPGH